MVLKGPTPPWDRGEKFDFPQKEEKRQINLCCICCFNWVKMRERKKRSDNCRGCKWVVSCSGCNPCCTTSSGYWCCFTHSDKAEFNYFYTWNTPMVISIDLQHVPVGEAKKKKKDFPSAASLNVKNVYFHCLSPWQRKVVCFHAHSRSSVTRCLTRCQNRSAHSFIK